MNTRRTALVVLVAAAVVLPVACRGDPPRSLHAGLAAASPARAVPAGTPQAFRALWSRSDAEQEAALREAWRRPDEALPVFLSFLRGSEDAVPLDRSEVARFLCRFRTRTAAGVVRAFVHGDSPLAAFALDRLSATGGLGSEGARSVPDLVSALDVPALRGPALRALRVLGPSAAPAAARIVRLLDDPACECVGDAAAALGASCAEPERAVPALVRHIDEEACVLALGAYGARAWTAIDALAARVALPVAGTLRSGAAESLLRIGPAAERTLIALVRHPVTGPDVVRTFACIDGPSPGAAFSEAVGEFAVTAPRALALDALRALESRAGQGAGAIPAVRRIACERGLARAAAIEAFARIGPSDEVGAVVDAALGSDDVAVRAAAAEAAWRAAPVHPGRIARVAGMAVGDGEARVRYAAASSLVVVPGGMDALDAALAESPDAGSAAARAAMAVYDIRLGRTVTDGAALASVLVGATDAAPLRREAIRALAESSADVPPESWGGADPASLARAVVAWRDGDPRWWPTEGAWRRVRAARRLGGTGAAAWFELVEGGPCRRRIVADTWETEFAALGESVEPYVVAGLSDEDPAVRAAAARAAPWLRPEIARSLAPRLDGLLDDPSPAVRAAALRGLRGCNSWDENRAARVTALLEDRDPAVRVAAATTLWRCTGDMARALPVVAAAVTVPVSPYGPVNPQCEAAETLRAMGAGAALAVGDLRECLRTLQHPFTWEAVCDTLAAIGPAASDATPELELAASGGLTRGPMLEIVDAAVYRVPAIRALARVAGTAAPAAPVLTRAAADRNHEIRASAREALASLR